MSKYKIFKKETRVYIDSYDVTAKSEQEALHIVDTKETKLEDSIMKEIVESEVISIVKVL